MAETRLPPVWAPIHILGLPNFPSSTAGKKTITIFKKNISLGLVFFQVGFVNSLKFANSGNFLVAGVGQEHRYVHMDSIHIGKQPLHMFSPRLKVKYTLLRSVLVSSHKVF